MKIDAFSTLDAVLRGGTLAAAAHEMNLTPSAISMQMKQLEAYLGQPLFDRSGLQVKPMKLAHEVSSVMRDALQQLESLRKRASVSIEGSVRLGVIESMQPIVLPATMRLLRERYPRLELRPARGRSASLIAAVKAGDLDAALVAQPESGGSARLRWQPMLRRELVLVAPPTATESSVAALFKQYDWIRYDRSTVTGTLAARFVSTQVREKRGTLEFDSTPAIVAMVSGGLGISVVQIADPGLVATYPVRIVRLGRGAPMLQLSLVTRKTDDDSRTLAAMREAMHTALMTAQRQRSDRGM
ncbi:LysR family transcriptional regulator [Variovorax sp. Varisp41]|jgi:DNA-binding transcriptional LysR family regulator|uniref:LysR family transcriptional regulator n=1 Tax=unclassified Variovorax TaxID=663243 RepID=UPI0021BBAC55|nr:LysR family transcriptional regulator [Variovorax sp. CY25R-8]MCT8178594.1 LysR family transcriptional regulator [Variovorax sp. CY25R-8]